MAIFSLLLIVCKIKSAEILDNLTKTIVKYLGYILYHLLPYFMLARKLVTIAWLEARKTNPGIRYYFPTAIARAIQYYQRIVS